MKSAPSMPANGSARGMIWLSAFIKSPNIITAPAFTSPAQGLSTGINLDVWNSLTKAQQSIIRSACATENDATTSEYNYKNAAALDTLITKHKVEVRSFSDEIMQAIKATSTQVLEEAAAKDAFTGKVYESFKASLKNSMRWAEVSEEAYTQIRRKV
jgi:TRAP-type mannitol/chloroaromatic compound transport system substrate-binding protein